MPPLKVRKIDTDRYMDYINQIAGEHQGNIAVVNSTPVMVVTPEPSYMWLVGIGIIGMLLWRGLKHAS